MYVELKNINKSFGKFRASQQVSFEIDKGKLIGLLGPSGGGKTTILRMIAGLESPDSGDIIIDGIRVNDIAAGKRGIGFVFQNYALFRHMTVYDNIAFGLEVQRMFNYKIERRVNALIELIGLKGLERRYPHQLSGGQRQRVAFARALAPNPRLLLLDEPFAAIDSKLRKELRTWLRQMIDSLGITSIFVTHDQEEAVEVADEIIIIDKGRIEQKGTPVEIYKAPKTAFVAQFIGQSDVIDQYTSLKGFEAEPCNFQAIVRPEFVQIGKDSEEIRYPSASEKGIVHSIFFRGNSLEIKVLVKGVFITANRSLEQAALGEGEEVFVLIHRLYLFNDTQAKVVENNAKVDPLPVFI